MLLVLSAPAFYKQIYKTGAAIVVSYQNTFKVQTKIQHSSALLYLTVD